MRFSYTAVDNNPISLMPRLPMTLYYQNRAVDVVGLVDSEASRPHGLRATKRKRDKRRSLAILCATMKNFCVP